MKKAFIIFVLLLTTGAFQNFWFADADSLSALMKGDAQLQWFWLGVDLMVACVCLFRVKEILQAAREHIPMQLFVVWGALSISWSLDPVLSVRRIAALICTSALGLYLGIEYDIKSLMRLVGTALVIAVVGSFVVGLLLPSYGVMGFLMQGAWRGLFIHKNTMARVMVLAAICLYPLASDSQGHQRGLYRCAFFGALALIVLSHSATSAIVLVLSLGVGFWSRLRLSTFANISFVALVLLVVLAASLLLEGKSDAVLSFLGKDATLSGRTELWRLSFAAVWQHPFLGSGWDVFWTTAEADRIRVLCGWDAPHAHNAFLDFSLNVGVVGLLFFLAGLFDGIRKALRYASGGIRPLSLLPLLFYCFVFFYMFSETMIVDRHSIFQILFCAIPVAMKREEEKESIDHLAGQQLYANVPEAFALVQT